MNTSCLRSTPISLTARGTISFTEHIGEVVVSDISMSDVQGGDIYVKIREPRRAWYYANKAWHEVGTSPHNPIHPHLVPPRILSRTESRLTWLVASSAQPTPDLDILSLSDYLERL